jgi:hypothetical protein
MYRKKTPLDESTVGSNLIEGDRIPRAASSIASAARHISAQQRSETISGGTDVFSDPLAGFRTVLAPNVSACMGNVGPRYHGVYLGGVSSYNGIPFFSDESESWIQLRTGSKLSLRERHSNAPPWQRQNLKQRKPFALDESWDIPERAVVETYYSVYCSSALGLVFPIVDISNFTQTIDLAYQKQPKESSLNVIGAKACVLSFTSIMALMSGQLDSHAPIDTTQCSLKAQMLFTHIILEASPITLQVCIMQVRNLKHPTIRFFDL